MRTVRGVERRIPDRKHMVTYYTTPSPAKDCSISVMGGNGLGRLIY